MERSLRKTARKRRYRKERTDAYVYGTMSKRKGRKHRTRR
jgi:hypothetical protein